VRLVDSRITFTSKFHPSSHIVERELTKGREKMARLMYNI